MNPYTSLSPILDLDANADSPRPSLTRLILRSSASTFADANHTPYNEDLLTPPLTNSSLDEPPFRPAGSDRTSLRMKWPHGSLHQRRRRHNRSCVSSGDVDETALFKSERPGISHPPPRSRSAPSLTKLFCAAFRGNKTCKMKGLHLLKKPPDEIDFVPRCDSLLKHPRRWTMPGKAAPTRVLTSMFPSAELAEPNVNDGGHTTKRAVIIETPAMIILQRVASGRSRRTSLRPEAYTSFPTPIFTKPSSSFVTTLFRDGWQRSDTTFINASIESVLGTSQTPSSPSGSGRASVDHSGVRPSHSTTAAPVCTGVVFDPVVESQIGEPQPAFRARRCSTMYVSDASTYEVIWAENVSNSSRGDSRRTSSEQTRGFAMRDNDIRAERRRSVAVDKLETQLSKGIQQSRKASLASRGYDSVKDVAPTHRSTTRKDFHNMLNFQKSNFDVEEEPRRLSRSRASTVSKHKLTSPDDDVQLTTMTGDDVPIRQIDLFPPLSTNRTGSATASDPVLINPWLTSLSTRSAAVGLAAPKKVDDRISSHQRRGSKIGQSTGLRKKSVLQQRPRLERNTGITRRKTSVPVEDDRKPLLGQFNMWPDEVFPDTYAH